MARAILLQGVILKSWSYEYETLQVILFVILVLTDYCLPCLRPENGCKSNWVSKGGAEAAG